MKEKIGNIVDCKECPYIMEGRPLLSQLTTTMDNISKKLDVLIDEGKKVEQLRIDMTRMQERWKVIVFLATALASVLGTLSGAFLSHILEFWR